MFFDIVNIDQMKKNNNYCCQSRSFNDDDKENGIKEKKDQKILQNDNVITIIT